MTNYELEPLVRGAANEAERRLLETAKDDGSKPGAREAMLAALGVPPLPPHERATERILRGSGASAVHGVVLVLFVGAVLGAGVVLERSSRTSQTAPGSAPREVPADSSAAAAASNELVATPDSLPSVAPTPTVKSVEAPRTKAIVTGPSARPSTDELAAEIARVEAARASLGQNEPEKTLRLLRDYDREFPRGAFAVEVSVLRIEALVRAGRVDEARRLGARFLEQHREGAFARRVRATLATSDSTRHDGPSVE